MSNVIQFKSRSTLLNEQIKDEKLLIIVSGNDATSIVELITKLADAANVSDQVTVKRYLKGTANKISIVNSQPLVELECFLAGIIEQAGYAVEVV